MIIIKIALNSNGSHSNQTLDNCTPETFPVPEGWAVIPASLGTPETLEHFPFGDITVEDVDGVPTVTSWTPLPIPEPEKPEPEPEPPASLEARVDALETETAAISAAIERGMSL